jgi:oxygen-independent coproporphyrinogen-3 oxidase
MLGLRLADGMALGPSEARARRLAGDGLVELEADRGRLTLRGRLLADHVVRELTPG